VTTVTYIIDGNNLAHELFRPAARGQAQAEIDRRLVEHLSAWVAQHGPERVAVEVYFDGAQEALADLPGVKVRVAQSGSPADEDVLHRAKWYTFYHKPCVVVSNDRDLRQAAQEAGARVISASDFVSWPNAPRPRFARPPDRSSSSASGPGEDISPRARWQRAFEEARRSSAAGKPARQQAEGALRTPPGGARTWDDAIQAARAALHTSGRAESGIQPDSGSSSLPSRPEDGASEGAEPRPGAAGGGRSPSIPPAVGWEVAQIGHELAELAEGTCYRISFETWPVAAGRRFLIDSLCPVHRAEIADLLAAFDEQNFTRQDLRALAEILLDSCGGEPDFVRRGSLMDQARRALLLAGDAALPIAVIAHATGRSPAELHRKLKQNEGKWIERAPARAAG
jgi:hypothetical protein